MTTQTRRGARLSAHAARTAASNGSIADVTRQARRLGVELGEVGETVRGIVAGCRVMVRNQLRRQLYRTLAAATGVGYVLGGGLPRGVVHSVLMIGGRLVLESAVTRAVAGAAPHGRKSEPR